jgi:hypothetical protein
MADKYPTINGNWSNPLIWNGLSKPIAGDDVYADGKTVTIDENVNVGTIRNTLRSGGTTGGAFLVTSGGFTITTTSAQGFFPNIGTYLLQLSHTTGTNIINGSIVCPGTSNNGISISGVGGTTNINGNITTNGASIALLVSAAATVNIVGNLQAGTSSICCSITAAATLTVIGNVTGAAGGGGAGINNASVAATITITGNVTGQAGAGISSNQNSTINITGNLTANNTNAVSLTASPTTTVVGTITASNSAVGLNQTGGTVTFSGTAINASNGAMAIYCPTIRLYNANTVEWRFRDELGNVKTLYSAGIALGNPAITNVRSGITYGASLELTGTMIVPSPSDVRISVPTDNTVGTGQLTAADFLAAIAASSDPIAVRLNNVSTVDTSGAQMASYNV